MKNILFLIASVATGASSFFAAYMKLMYGDTFWMAVSLVLSIILVITSIIDILFFTEKGKKVNQVWLLSFFLFNGWAQVVFYSKKLLHKN